MVREPKRKTNKLSIIALPPCSGWDELSELEAQGHTVHRLEFPVAYDLVLGECCWRMTEKHRQYLKLAVAEARKRIK